MTEREEDKLMEEIVQPALIKDNADWLKYILIPKDDAMVQTLFINNLSSFKPMAICLSKIFDNHKQYALSFTKAK